MLPAPSAASKWLRKLKFATFSYDRISGFKLMRHSLHIPIAPGRKLAAWVCLLAVLLLWSPLWAAAWQADGMACCSGGLCPAHGHTGAVQLPAQQAPPSQTPMECDHHGSQKHSRTITCSMSCCHESANSFLAAVIFLLPAPAMIFQANVASAAPAQLIPAGSVPSFEPPSPPPRTSLLSV